MSTDDADDDNHDDGDDFPRTEITTMDDRQATIDRILKLPKPRLLLILSGKRKCGKDFVEQQLLEQYRDTGSIISFRISAPIKREFARRHNLDYQELLTASGYKEEYRSQMVEWSEDVRRHDPHHFLRLTILDAFQENRQRYPDKSPPVIWILNDARRPSDLQYFQEDSKEINLGSETRILRIRIECNDTDVRQARGWQFTPGIDDQTTECGLDHFNQWDLIIQNDGTRDQLLERLKPVFQAMDEAIK